MKTQHIKTYGIWQKQHYSYPINDLIMQGNCTFIPLCKIVADHMPLALSTEKEGRLAFWYKEFNNCLPCSHSISAQTFEPWHLFLFSLYYYASERSTEWSECLTCDKQETQKKFLAFNFVLVKAQLLHLFWE